MPRGPCDPLGGAHAAFATLVALAGRDRTGAGALVEVPLIEGALNVTAEPVVEYGITGRIMGRDGNRSAHAAPQGLYSCADGAYLAVSVATDDRGPLWRRRSTPPTWLPTPSWATWPAVVATTTASTPPSTPGRRSATCGPRSRSSSPPGSLPRR